MTLLRVPLLHNCAFYQGDHPHIYSTIAESTFRNIVNKLANTMGTEERVWFLEELTKGELDELAAKAELEAMRIVLDKVKEHEFIQKEIDYPVEFHRLYEKYEKTHPFVIDEQGQKWELPKNKELLTKEAFMWAVYSGDYHLVSPSIF